MFRLKDGWKTAKISLRSAKSKTAPNKKSQPYSFKYGPAGKKKKNEKLRKKLKKCLGCAFLAGRCLLQSAVLVWRSALECRLFVCLVVLVGVLMASPSAVHFPRSTIRHCQWQPRFDQLHCRRQHSSSFIQCRIGFGPHGVCVLCEIPYKKLFHFEKRKEKKNIEVEQNKHVCQFTNSLCLKSWAGLFVA